MIEPTFSDDYVAAYDASGDAGYKALLGRSEVVTISKRKWLVGMRWRSYESQAAMSDELAQDAENMRADWIARRSGTEAIQVGFAAALHDKWPSGVFSLAALLADSHKVPWAGAFDLGDGQWWYIAVRDNYAMMPDGDVVGTFTQIQASRQEHSSLEDFTHVNGTRADLERLIAHAESVKTKRTAVESLTAPRLSAQTKLAIAGVVLSALAIGGGYLYFQHAQEQALIARRAQRAHEVALKAQMDALPNVEKLLRAAPDPGVWLEACHTAVYGRPLWQNGWQLMGDHCTGTQLLTTWSRGPGATIAYMPPSCIPTIDGNACTQSIPLPLPAGASGSDNAVVLQDARMRLVLWGQQHNIVITFIASKIQVPQQPGPVDRALGANAPAPVASVDVQFSVPAAPFALDFSGLPGLRLTELMKNDLTAGGTVAGSASTGSANDWNFSGVLYGR